MRFAARVFASVFALGLTAVAAQAKPYTYVIDFGAPGHTEYNGKDFADAKIVNSSNPGDPGDNFSIKGLEFKLDDAVLHSDLVGAYNLDGDADAGSMDALTKSFIFSNSDNPTVGASVTLTLKGVKSGDKITFAFIRSSQNFDAHVTVAGGDKKEEKDVTTDKEFTTVGTLTGSDTYTITITNVSGATGEADIAGAKITIDSGD